MPTVDAPIVRSAATPAQPVKYHVHELTLDDVKRILDDSINIQPRRQMTVQFSGGSAA